MARFPYQYVNISGIPTIKTQSVSVSDTVVNFKFNPDFDSRPFRGLILVYVSEAIPEGTTTTLPIVFSMAGTTSYVTAAGGDNITVADLPGVGIYLIYFDRWTDTLQMIGVTPATTTTQSTSGDSAPSGSVEPDNSTRTAKK